MDKYIKESDLFKRILNVDFKHDYDGCIKFCQSIPAADVAEVRNGRWEQTKELSSKDCGLLFFGKACSICGNIADEQYNYCPNCGAKMEEVEE